MRSQYRKEKPVGSERSGRAGFHGDTEVRGRLSVSRPQSDPQACHATSSPRRRLERDDVIVFSFLRPAVLNWSSFKLVQFKTGPVLNTVPDWFQIWFLHSSSHCSGIWIVSLILDPVLMDQNR